MAAAPSSASGRPVPSDPNTVLHYIARLAAATTAVAASDTPLALTCVYALEEAHDRAVLVPVHGATKVIADAPWLMFSDVDYLFGLDDLSEMAGYHESVVYIARLLDLPISIMAVAEEVRYLETGAFEARHCDEAVERRCEHPCWMDVDDGKHKYIGRLLCRVPTDGLMGGAVRVYGYREHFVATDRKFPGSSAHATGQVVSNETNDTVEYIFVPSGIEHAIENVTGGAMYLMTAQIFLPVADNVAYQEKRGKIMKTVAPPGK